MELLFVRLYKAAHKKLICTCTVGAPIEAGIYSYKTLSGATQITGDPAFSIVASDNTLNIKFIYLQCVVVSHNEIWYYKVLPAGNSHLLLGLLGRVDKLQIKPRKKFWGFNRIRTHDLRDTGVMLYRLSYEASPEAGQMRVQFIPQFTHDLYPIHFTSVSLFVEENKVLVWKACIRWKPWRKEKDKSLTESINTSTCKSVLNKMCTNVLSMRLTKFWVLSMK